MTVDSTVQYSLIQIPHLPIQIFPIFKITEILFIILTIKNITETNFLLKSILNLNILAKLTKKYGTIQRLVRFFTLNFLKRILIKKKN